MRKMMPFLLTALVSVSIVAPMAVVANEAVKAAAPAAKVEAPKAEVEAALASVEAAPAPAPAVEEVPLGKIFDDVMSLFKNWKAMGWQAALAALLTLLISTMKNSMLRALLWSKLPEWSKVLVAPFLGIVIFVLGSKGMSLGAILAGLTTGMAAVYVHQLLDGLKLAPFVGEKMKAMIEVLSKLMKKA